MRLRHLFVIPAQAGIQCTHDKIVALSLQRNLQAASDNLALLLLDSGLRRNDGMRR
jgi:hypothetical protein